MRFKKSIIILMGVVLLSTAFSPAILNRNSSSKPEFSASVSTLNPRSFQPQPFKQRQLDFDIFGYRVNPIDTFPITRDEQGTLHLEQLKKGYLNIKIDSRFGFFYFNSIIVEQEIYIDLNSEFIQRYEIEDPLQGFFSELRVTGDIIWINIAFDNNLYQFNYDGVLEQNDDRFELTPLDDPLIYYRDADFSKMREPNAIETIDYLKFIQTNSLKIDNKKYLEETQLMTLGPGVIYTKYGLLHENWVKTDNWEELCDFGWLPSYWQGHTSIDVGVTRYHGYESQVKSDIQYYNKDYIEETFTGYARDTKCYQMVCHGGDDYGEDEWYLYTHVKHTFLWWTWWTWEHLGTITPSEIENLWYTESGGYYYINVYPTNAIIFAMVCHGFYDNPSSMAHAWYDDGAEAFVSAIISIPVVGSDDFNYAFWEELCDNGGTVESATVALCDYYNTYLGSGWNYGDEWRILGNEDATEP